MFQVMFADRCWWLSCIWPAASEGCTTSGQHQGAWPRIVYQGPGLCVDGTRENGCHSGSQCWVWPISGNQPGHDQLLERLEDPQEEGFAGDSIQWLFDGLRGTGSCSSRRHPSPQGHGSAHYREELSAETFQGDGNSGGLGQQSQGSVDTIAHSCDSGYKWIKDNP